MTNLEIIKYLSHNNPARLAEFLGDIYWDGRNYITSSRMGRTPKSWGYDEFKKWLKKDAKKCTLWYEDELEEWSQVINGSPTITACYDNLAVTFPVKDADHMWNNNNEYDYKENNNE